MEPRKKELINALNEDNFGVSLSIAKELESEYPNVAEVKVLHGDIFMKMSNYVMALEKYERAMKLNPSDPNIYSKLGMTHALQNRWEQALNCFRSAMNIAKNDYIYQGYYGWAMLNCGKLKEDKILVKEAYTYLFEAMDNGIQMDIIDEAMAEFHIENATSTWSVVREKEGDASYATKFQHITDAKQELYKASHFMENATIKIRDKHREVQNLILDLEKRAFRGYPYVRRAAIIGGVLLLLFGATFWGTALLVMAGLYHHSHLMPGYVHNRKLLKGNNKDPFWIRRINSIGEFASGFSFFGSFTSVFFMSWAFSLFTSFVQHTIAIFILPFLIVAGYTANYDLTNRIKQLVSSN